jgi:hypothetical protein
MLDCLPFLELFSFDSFEFGRVGFCMGKGVFLQKNSLWQKVLEGIATVWNAALSLVPTTIILVLFLSPSSATLGFLPLYAL